MKWKILDNTISWLCVCLLDGRGTSSIIKLEQVVFEMTCRLGDHWANQMANIVAWEEQIFLTDQEELELMAWQRLSRLIEVAAITRATV